MTDPAHSTFAARLFGPGLPGGGAAVQVNWQFGKLCCTAEGIDVEADPAAIKLTAAGFNHGETRLDWQDGAGSYALFLAAADTPAFAAAAPAALGAGFKQAATRRRSVERRFRLGWAVLGTILLLPVIAVLIFYLKAEAIAEWVAERIPTQFEAQIGELTLAQARTQSKLLEDGPAVEALRHIGGKLTAGSPHQYRWFVAQSQDINAYAAPGGVVVVNAGLLRAADSPEELAGVLAHEVSHVELRHSLKGAIKESGFNALLALALGDYSGTLAGQAAAGLTGLKFSRDAETQADQAGLQRLLAAGIDPRGMPQFFAKLAAREGNAKLPALFSTHPLSDARKAQLDTAIAALPARTYAPLEVDWGRVKAALGKATGQ